MLIHANRKELQQLARYFYNISKTLISIYDADMNIITRYPAELCDFCSRIRQSQSMHERCLHDDNQAFEHCKRTRQTYIYKCHMGLVEVATPIIHNDLIMGYMLFGQIADQRDKADVYKQLSSLPEKLGLDMESLIQAAGKLKYRSRDYIESISALMEMCANYIWLNNIIEVRNDSLAYNIDQYIREHIDGDLAIETICNHFHIGRSKLYELSQSHFGCGISKYIQLCRLNHAKELLTNLDLSIVDVAESVGFKDVNYFIRFFKKYTAVTPKKYQVGQKPAK